MISGGLSIYRNGQQWELKGPVRHNGGGRLLKTNTRKRCICWNCRQTKECEDYNFFFPLIWRNQLIIYTKRKHTKGKKIYELISYSLITGWLIRSKTEVSNKNYNPITSYPSPFYVHLSLSLSSSFY